MFLIQPTTPPVNDNMMELLIMIDACKRASARSITAVLPYFGYARADRKTQVRDGMGCGGSRLGHLCMVHGVVLLAWLGRQAPPGAAGRCSSCSCQSKRQAPERWLSCASFVHSTLAAVHPAPSLLALCCLFHSGSPALDPPVLLMLLSWALPSRLGALPAGP